MDEKSFDSACTFLSRKCRNHKIILAKRKEGTELTRKLIIDGNAVYEIDEDCMLKNRVENGGNGKDKQDVKSEHGEKNSQKSTAEHNKMK